MSLQTPVIITNFKTYAEASGQNAIKLARIHEQVAKESGASIAIAVQAVDLAAVCQSTTLPVFAQHIDPDSYGSHTGSVIAESVKGAGAIGTLLNHSERRLEWNILKKSVERAKEVGLIVCVCAKDPAEGGKIARELNPDFVAVEPPELIGGDISVSTAQPEVITQSIELIGNEKLLVGAGVKDQQDVKIALEFGANGVLLASGVVKATDAEKVLRDLVKGLQNL